MSSVVNILLAALFLVTCSVQAQGTSHEELPDDYLPFTLHQLDEKLEGESEFLDGFKFS